MYLCLRLMTLHVTVGEISGYMSFGRPERAGNPATLVFSNMSREIRTPMKSILGFAELLKEPDLTIDEQQDYIQTIQISGTRMLNTILGLSEVLIEEIRSLNIDEIEGIARNINKSATITNKLLEDILMWSRAQQGSIAFKPRNLSLSNTCRNILEILNPSAYAKKITIYDSSADNINVYADSDMLKTILLNLVSNAITEQIRLSLCSSGISFGLLQFY